MDLTGIVMYCMYVDSVLEILTCTVRIYIFYTNLVNPSRVGGHGLLPEARVGGHGYSNLSVCLFVCLILSQLTWLP